MLRVNNVILNIDKIIYVIQDRGDVNKVRVIFDGDLKLDFVGAEAAELWKELDPDKRHFTESD